MRLVRYINENGVCRLGREDQPGSAVPLRGAFPGSFTADGSAELLVRRLAPLVPANVYCIGLNYREHAAESGMALPKQPVVFMKPTSAVVGSEAPIEIPAECNPQGEVDYECELAVVIGKAAKNVSESEALHHVFGYTAANDVSARDWQLKQGGGQWCRGKSFDSFCPLGPVIVTADEIPDPQRLRISTRLNGRTVQDHTTGDMIFSVAQIISFLSISTTLLPGTVILTGTPQGVGFSRKPPEFLKPGDLVEVEIERIGVLCNPVTTSALVAKPDQLTQEES